MCQTYVLAVHFLKKSYNTYYTITKRGLAVFFLMLFLNGFVIETFAYHWNESCQTEIVDFEGEKDTEEDNKDEKEKENKILEQSEILPYQAQEIPDNCTHLSHTGSEEILEVLSPPPDLG